MRNPTDPLPTVLPADALRSQAESRLQAGSAGDSALPAAPGADATHLLHELQVHQIELGLQNEELQKNRDAAEAAAARYADLYDFAPVGYLTLDRGGYITQVNLAAEQLLGHARSYLGNKRLGTWVAEASLPAFATFVRQAFETGAHPVCELQLHVNGQTIIVQVDASVSDDEQECRLVLIDITQSKQVQQDLQQSHDDLRALANRLQTGREEQRAHLAREIHDVLAQELTRLKIDVSWMKRKLGAPVDEPLRQNLLVRAGQAMALIDSSITTVQWIATELRPVILDSLGLFAAMEWQVEDFAQRSGLQCSALVPQHGVPPARDISIVLFRILQESLTNVARHAQATEVRVTLALQNDTWVLTVHDNGVGITDAQIAAHRSLGLLGMGERALAIGGSVHFVGTPSEGTTITARVPVAAEA